MFAVFDQDSDAKIDAHELWIVLRTLGKNKTIAEIGQMIPKHDTDGNGTFDFPEFLEIMWRGELLD
ncbi:EF-hand domain-containing protein [Pedobacter sp. NJ-S-72]